MCVSLFQNWILEFMVTLGIAALLIFDFFPLIALPKIDLFPHLKVSALFESAAI